MPTIPEEELRTGRIRMREERREQASRVIEPLPDESESEYLARSRKLIERRVRDELR